MKFRFATWFILAAVFALAAGYRYQPGWLQTDIVSLAQNPHTSPASLLAEQRQSALLQQNLLWLLVSDTKKPADLAAATEILAQKLMASPAIVQVQYQWAERERFQREWELLFPARQQLLSRADRKLLESSPQALAERQLQAIYGLQGASAGLDLERDPFATFRHYFIGERDISAQIEKNIPLQRSGDRLFTLIQSRVKPLQLQGRIDMPLSQLQVELQQWAESRGMQLIAAGAPLHTEYAAAGAQREIQFIGGLSLLAICLLSLAIFRSARPLLLCLLAIGSGVASGAAAVIALLGTMHILAFVFGTTVTGLAIDYAFHFICNRLRPGPARDADVMPGLLLGLLSSCLAFFALALAPFPLLQQMGVFVGFGLLGAWLTVVLLFPALLQVRQKPVQMPKLLQCHENSGYFPAVCLLLVSGLVAMTQIEYADDLQLFYQPPQHLVQDEQALKKLVPARPESRYFLVEGADWSQVMQREWALTRKLETLKRNRQLGDYRAISDKLPPREIQRQNWQGMQNFYTGAEAQGFYRQLGFDARETSERLERIQQPFAELNPSEWLALAGEEMRSQWLGCEVEFCASLVRLYGAKHLPQISPIEGVLLIDPVADMAKTMSAQRDLLLKIFPFIFLIAFAVIAIKTGIKKAASVIALPLAAVGAALAAIVLSGSALNIFHVAGLLLVFGIGVDYAIFGHLSAAEERGYTFLAIVMAGITTLLGFGLLALSKTPAIANFGLTLAVGTSLTLMLAILFFSRADKGRTR